MRPVARPLALVTAAALSLIPVGAIAGDVEKGARAFRKCAACHVAEENGPKKPGPNLWGVVGRGIGTLEGFDFSTAMVDAGKAGRVWSEEELDVFVTEPRSALKGSKMTFAGIKKADERADLIAYLKTRGPASN